jgi:hypothetical protein
MHGGYVCCSNNNHHNVFYNDACYDNHHNNVSYDVCYDDFSHNVLAYKYDNRGHDVFYGYYNNHYGFCTYYNDI